MDIFDRIYAILAAIPKLIGLFGLVFIILWVAVVNGCYPV